MIESWKWEAVARLHELHKTTPIPGVVLDALFGDYNVPCPPKTPRVWIASEWLAMTIKGQWDAEVISPPHKVQSLKQWATSSWRRPEEFAYLAAWAEKLPAYINWRVDWDGLVTQIHPIIWVSAFGALVATIEARPKSAVLEIIGGSRFPLSPPAPYNPPVAENPPNRGFYYFQEDSLAALLLNQPFGSYRPDPKAWEPVLSAAAALQQQKYADHDGPQRVGVVTDILAEPY